MPDREKILRGAKCCKYVEPSQNGCPEECPYLPEEHLTCGLDPLLDDVIALLREQEPAKPREERHEVKVSHDWGDEVEVWSEFYCPYCGAMIAKGNSERYPRCMWCGKAVKWDA